MITLHESAWLDVWEQGYSRSPCERAVLLATAHAGDPSVVEWTVGRRDSYLLRLRQAAFGGDVVEAVCHCLRCGEKQEIDFRISSLLADSGQTASRRAFETEDWSVEFRLPTSADLLALQAIPPSARRRALLERCIEKLRRGMDEDCVALLDDGMAERVESEMADGDPLADVRLEWCCNGCQAAQSSAFDVVAFLWSEVDVWAKRLLGEIHTLASAYGWSEQEILALSPWRRQLYVEMVRQ